MDEKQATGKGREAIAEAVGREVTRAESEGAEAYQATTDALAEGVPPEVMAQVLFVHRRQDPEGAAREVAAALPPDITIAVIAKQLGLAPDEIRARLGFAPAAGASTDERPDLDRP
jgi:hypothetical protein